MSARIYDLTTCVCVVSASEAVHQAMAHYLSAYQRSEVDKPTVELAVKGDATSVASVVHSLTDMRPDAIRKSHLDQRYRVWTTSPQDEVLLPERTLNHVITTSGNRISVTADRESIGATIAVRIVRQLVMRGGESWHGRAVHAGAVDLNGHGVLVGGKPGAGKTSVLTRLVENHGAHPIANDRTMLIPSQSRQWLAVGVPLAWRFTPEGLAGSSRLAYGLRHRHSVRGRDLVDGKAEFTPMEISQIFNRQTVSMAQVDRIVVLVNLLDDVPGAPDVTFLRHRLDFGRTDFFAEDWLRLRDQLSAPDKRHTNLYSWWSRVAATIPVKVLTWTSPTELPRVAAEAAGVRR